VWSTKSCGEHALGEVHVDLLAGKNAREKGTVVAGAKHTHTHTHTHTQTHTHTHTHTHFTHLGQVFLALKTKPDGEILSKDESKHANHDGCEVDGRAVVHAITTARVPSRVVCIYR
jgi:hypothetical protein